MSEPKDERQALLVQIGEFADQVFPWQVVLNRNVSTKLIYGYYVENEQYMLYINDETGTQHIVYETPSELGVLRSICRRLKAQAKLCGLHREVAEHMLFLYQKDI